MRLINIVAFAVAFSPGALAKCKGPWGQVCEWHGSAPFCGSSSASFGDVDSDGLTLVASSEKDDLLNDLGGYDCTRDYGYGCWTGYKRLWCEETSI
ncbi:hypothetical protein B0J13DRAFT_569807 [Dactylonectria estremocensis]|uniref:Uncharacterized protein n=1 Tax=Dactylonectria estremocensis TaxID=1079267 RepID=A0A9P9DFX1_9HYPO|nr:hypothetical protein B0J13DRAFT_576220 [Dactylonectria estremocensis]KAH7118212.1 hypothetical protein B0J13DRAFT_569807 [Dactylonectria estremocensis]